MVKELFHIFRTYFLTFRFIKLNEFALFFYIIFIFILMFENWLLSYFLNFNAVDYCSTCFFHGIDFLFNYFIFTDFLNFNLFFQLFSSNFLFDLFDFFFFFFWFKNLYIDSYQIVFTLFLDLNIYINFFNFYFLSSWYKSFLFTNEFTNLFVIHPEITIIKFYYLNYFFNKFFFYAHTVNSLNENAESYLFFFNYIFNLIFLSFLFFLFISWYFSFYLNYYQNENSIDLDYINNNILIEAEKEITSVDDIIISLFLIINIFGWYFFFNFWYLFSILPELVFTFLFIFFLYFLIFGIPSFLIFDFGIYFLVYLKGIGNGTIFFFELLFDYIAVIIFYTRILVQCIRLVLMLFTYASMHDLVLFFYFGNGLFFGLDDVTSNFLINFSSFDLFTYFLFFKLIGLIFYWIYEILHTFFVVTVQFSAFFAIVFWLFLFLYSFFVIEKHESYFFDKRILKKKKKKKCWNFIF